MDTRKLTTEERKTLEDGEGVPSDMRVTCEHDNGHGPCGTFLDWTDCRCSRGAEIEIETDN
jgi:hypothetical protein